MPAKLPPIPSPGCVYPMSAWQPKEGSETQRRIYRAPEGNGLRYFQTSPPKEFARFFSQIEVPCGKCIVCRLNYSMTWATRIVAESGLYERNCFVTLTYAPEHLPKNEVLVKKHLVDFKKRLRDHYSGHQVVPGVKLKPNQSNPIRTYECGEYGEDLGRPHYHLAILNFKPYDLLYYKQNKTGEKLYTCKSLEKIWGKGNVIVGDLTVDSARYVAGYVTKKINGKEKEDHYRMVDPKTGELLMKPQEYSTMSRRPGIGIPFLTKYPPIQGTISMFKGNGTRLERKLPKYFETVMEKTHPKLIEELKAKRIQFLIEHKKAHPEEYTHERRMVKLEVFRAKTKSVTRGEHKDV